MRNESLSQQRLLGERIQRLGLKPMPGQNIPVKFLLDLETAIIVRYGREVDVSRLTDRELICLAREVRGR